MGKALIAFALIGSISFEAAAEPADAAAPGAVATETEDVKQRFADAVRLFKDQKPAEALPLFRELAAATNSPNAHLYVGRCLAALGRNVEAHAAYTRTLKVVGEHADGKYEATREAAVLQIAELDARIAKLVISLTEVPPALAVRVDGEPVDPAALGSSLVLEPGAHRVEASADGRVPVAREVSIAGGEMKTLALALEPVEKPAAPAPPPKPAVAVEPESGSRGALRTIGFVASGVGVAGLATFAFAGLGAKSAHDELEADCASGCADAAHRDDADRGKRLQTVANVGLVVGIVGAAAGATFLYLGYSGASDSRESAASGGSLLLVRRGAVLGYRSAF